MLAAGFIKASKEYQAKGFKDFAVSAIGVCVDNFSMAKSNIVHSKRPRRQNPVLDFRYRIKKIDFWLATVLFNSKKVKPVRSRWFSTPGQIDIMEGYGGVLVRPEFFKPDDLYIPDPIWRVDDIWLSGLLAKRKIPVLANYYSRIPQAHDETIYALAEEITNGLSRQDLNQLAIKHFQKNYGVWL